MKKIEINLQLSLDEELDEAIYGGFYSHTRDDKGNVFVKTSESSPWIPLDPVNDWKQHRYIATEYTLKRIAAHFIRIGKHLKETRQ